MHIYIKEQQAADNTQVRSAGNCTLETAQDTGRGRSTTTVFTQFTQFT